MLTNEEGNQLIKKYLKNNTVFAAGRVGSSEILSAYSFDNGNKIYWDGATNSVLPLLQHNAGVYGPCGPQSCVCVEDFCREYIEGIKSCDIQVYWPMVPIAEAQDKLFTKYCKDANIVDNRSVEPFYFEDSWAHALKGKKVLVISPFTKSIKSQYDKRLSIWPNGLLPEFELVTYTSVQSLGGVGPHGSWTESLNIMKKDISKLDFDVALLGCGGYGLPLMAHIKEVVGKSSVYVGGGLQIMFGIKGKRWDSHPEISSFYNEHWVRPSGNEKPNTRFSMLSEPDTYW